MGTPLHRLYWQFRTAESLHHVKWLEHGHERVVRTAKRRHTVAKGWSKEWARERVGADAGDARNFAVAVAKFAALAWNWSSTLPTCTAKHNACNTIQHYALSGSSMVVKIPKKERESLGMTTAMLLVGQGTKSHSDCDRQKFGRSAGNQF
jgi:hypothetical protein